MKLNGYLILILIIIFNSCNEEDAKPVGKIELDVDIVYYRIHGLYETEVELDTSNYIILDVEAFQLGEYSVSTAEANGFRFTGSGDLSRPGSDNKIKLYGVGTPKSSGWASFELSTNSEADPVTINIYTFDNLDDQILIISGDLDGFDGEYTDHTLALSERGEVIWKHEGASSFSAVDNDVVYVNNSNSLMAINITDGSVIWSKPELANAASLSLVDNNLIVATKEGVYHAIETSNQSESWSFTPEVANFPLSAPVFNDEYIFVEDNGNIHSLKHGDGSIVWSAPTGKLSGTPVIHANTLLTGSEDYIQALNSDTGAERWQYNEPSVSSLLLVDDLVYYIPNYHSIRGLDITIGASQFYFTEFGDFEVSDAPIKYENSIIVLQTRFPGLTSFSLDSVNWSRGTYGYAEPIIQDDIIYCNGAFHSAETGEILLYLYNQTDYRVNIHEMLAIKNQLTGEVSYPAKSAMD